MDGIDNGSALLRLRPTVGDGDPAQLRSPCPHRVHPVPPVSPAHPVSLAPVPAEFRRKRDFGAAGGDGVKRVWRIAKRAKREGEGESHFDGCLHGRIVEASLRLDSAAAVGQTQRFEAGVESWGSPGAVQRELKSGVRPWRFMYFEKGEWVEFAEEANSVAWDCFRVGRETAEVVVGERVYLLNFEEMTQVNVATGFVRSIAWIGDGWEVSMPVNPKASPAKGPGAILGHRTTWRDGAIDSISSHLLGSDACELGGNVSGDRAPTSRGSSSERECGDDELTKLRLGGYRGVSSAVTPVVAAVDKGTDSARFSSTLGQRFVRVEAGSAESDAIKEKFLSGFGRFGDSTTITAIHRDSSATAAARLEAFERQKALTEEARGDANVRYGWHGTSKKGVAGIFLHGFGQPKTPKNGSAYGVGVYLAVENQAFVSALYADNDENGEQHMVLCKVIAGAAELVKPPSEQFHPSSEHFDTGVDDLLAPKRLIVWSTHMNTHILPLYVVSFKLPPRWHYMVGVLNGKHKMFSAFCHEASRKRHCFPKETCGMAEAMRNKPAGCATHQGPTSAFIRFPHLFGFLQRLLSPEQRLVLKNCYTKFEAGSMDRKTFVHEIQMMVGKDCLIKAIQMCQGFQGSQGASVIKAL